MRLRRSPPESHFPWGLVWLLAASALMNAGVLFQRWDTAVNHDALTYIAAAQKIAAGEFAEAAAIHPVVIYPLLIAFFRTFLPDWVSAARMISCLAVVAAMIPVYLLARDLFGEREARWAALAFAVSPEALRSSFQVVRDPLYTLCFLGFLLWGSRALASGSLRQSLLAALAALASLLVRPEGAVAFPLFVGFCLGWALLRPREWKRRLKPAVSWGAALCAVTAATWVAVPGGVPVSGRVNPYVHEYLLDLWRGEGLRNLERIENRLEAMEQESPYEIAGENFASFARKLIPWIYLGGMIAGGLKALSFSTALATAIGLSRFRPSPRHVFILWSAAGYAVFIFLFVLYRDFFDTRFLWVPLAALMPWAGRGISRLLSGLAGLRGGILLSWAAAALFFLLPLSKSNHLWVSRPDALIEASAWLAGWEELRGARWIATDDRIPFYANGQQPPPPGEIRCRKVFTLDVACLENAATREGIEVVVVFAEQGRLEAPRALEGYDPVREFADGRQTVLVFRRSPSGAPAARTSAGGGA